jgi:MFS family permease
MFSTILMSRFTASSDDAFLLMTFGLFGFGMGMINSQISVAAVSAMPPGQAGLASGIASASRQVGQALGVAIAGSLLTAKAHGHLRTAFLLASDPAWHLLFWCAAVVVVRGLLTTCAPPLVAQTLPMRVPQASEWIPRDMRSPLPPDRSERGAGFWFNGEPVGWPAEDGR